MKRGPQKETKPDFTGVPGELVSATGLNLVFGRGGKKSPYDALLLKLSEAKGNLLKFDTPRARASVSIRAKKLGFRISFAEQGGALYVRFDGHVNDDVRATRRAAIAETLKVSGPQSYIVLANRLREKGDASLNAGDVETIVLQMAKEGLVVRQEGNMWALNARPRGATA